MTNESAAQQADKAAGKAGGVAGTEGLCPGGGREGTGRGEVRNGKASSPARISALSHAAFRAKVNYERRGPARGGVGGGGGLARKLRPANLPFLKSL